MQDDGVDGDGSRDLDFTTTLPDSLDLDPAQVDAVPRGRALPFGSAAEPEMLGRYVVVDTLGRGGMGVVLRAFDRELDRPVALKVLHDDIEERDTTRLRREAQALAKLSHPNVVQVYEIGRIEGRTFVAMELVKGEPLDRWMRRDPRPDWRACVSVFLSLGAGLAAAHDRGLVHRDFKPGNAIIDEDGRPRVLDFGLARQAGDDVEDAPDVVQRARTAEQQVVPLHESVTKTGAVLGTPAYMSPEQMNGQEVDARSDQFSFCVALYEAAYGERPYPGKSMSALLVAIEDGDLRPAPKGTRVPGRLRNVLLRGLALDPAQRWPSMASLLAELRRLLAPRRRAYLSLGLFGGLAIIGVGIAYRSAVRPCTGAAEHLAGIWDSHRRKEVRGAILATGVPYAEDTWQRIEPRLDAYAGAWVAEHNEICEATNLRQEQSEEVMDLRMACLWDRRIALREAVEVLAGADQTRVGEAVTLVASLPRLERCDDVAALEAGVPLPDDPETADAVQELRGLLRRSTSLDEAGDYQGALEVSQEVMERAEALEYGPLLAEALVRRGGALDRVARYADAEQDLERGQIVAVEHEHDAVAAEAAAMLTWVVGVRRARYAEGLGLGRMALALARAPAAPPAVEADVLNASGVVLFRQGVLDRALSYHQRALAIREQELGPDHPDVAHSLNNIGLVLFRQRELDQALVHHRRALAIREQGLGPHHPHVAYSLSNIGSVLIEKGELDEALAHYQRALTIREEGLGPDHPEVAGMLAKTATLLLARGELPRARAYHRRALEIRERSLGPNHPDVATSLFGLAEVALAEGNDEAAREPAERALEIRVSSEAAPLTVANTRFLLARALWSDPQQRPRARALAEQAHEVMASLGVRAERLAEVEAWLEAHEDPRARRSEPPVDPEP
ncbi:MAG: serine/threonine protein kinase [Myxococcales bacterium]|nr:serine/threonine protein kinase [Myxococcales bacterium]MCB9716104.1 serine/threonine protein kinase [Myxococcales bacterium]